MQDRVEEKEIEYMRGKVAGHPVMDNKGNIIVHQGDVITDDLIRKARDANQLHYLMLAAVATVVGEGGSAARRRLEEFGDVSIEHEINYIRGKTVNRDVTDFAGNVIARKGDTVNDDVINQACEANAIQNLVLAVGAAGLEQAA